MSRKMSYLDMIIAVLESSKRTTDVMSRHAIVQGILKSFPALTGPRFVSSISRGLKQGFSSATESVEL